MSRARDIANYGDGIDTSSITSGTFADARIAASNVTQHEGSIDALASNPTITLGTNATGFTGVKQADQWRLTTSFSDTAEPISTNLERNDANFSLIGTGMSHSSGVFAFPQTGIYHVSFRATFSVNGDSRYLSQVIRHEGSTNIIAKNYLFIQQTSGAATFIAGNIDCIVDVADLSTDKVGFHVTELANTGVSTTGSDTSFYTGFTFIRLGDT